MNKILKNISFFMVFFAHLSLALIINYSMPSYEVLKIVDIEVKRVDNTKVKNKDLEKLSSLSKDIYFLYTKKPSNDEKITVFRNEDTKWGFPFYFKFNAADIQAKAASFSESKSLALVKYYGWRIQILSKFANIVSIKKVKDENELSYPIMSYILYFFVLISFVVSMAFVKSSFKKYY